MKKKKRMKKKRQDYNTIVSVIGSVVIIVGVLLVSYNYILSKKVIAYDYMANVFYLKTQEKNIEELKNPSTDNKEEVQPTVSDNSNNNNNVTNNFSIPYIGYLEIEKIHFKKGFLDKDSKDNDVEKNLYVAPNSNYPDVAGGNLIIAAHSGTGWKAFFNNLYKLGKGDKAVVTYNGKKYTYIVVNIYKQNKTGAISIYRNYDKTTLTLVTCTNDDDKTQTIYILELESIS